MWLRGRYLATFSSNCFAISRNQVAALVAAAVLVATSGHPRKRNRTHFTYDLYDEITRVGQTVSSTLAGDTARVGTLLLSRSVILNSSSSATLRISAEDSRCAYAF